MPAVVQEVDGGWKLVVDNGQRRAIHSRDPQREADRQAADLLGTNPTLIVAIGLGLGYLLDALDRRGWTGRVLALEPEPATVGPLQSRAIARAWTAAGRLRVLEAPAFHGASDCWSLFGDGSAEPAVFVNGPLARACPDAVAGAHALADRLRGEARANAEARRALGGRYLLNTLRNLPAITSEGDVASLRGAGRGLPCIIAAAGPSLDRALPALRDVQGRAFIISVDTALRTLLAAGITPHLVVGADPSEGNARHLTELPACPDTYLVAEGSVDPIALPAFRGRTFFFRVADHHPWPWLRSHGRDTGTLRAWGSVLTIAFDLALQMDCHDIIFAGADLAYTDDRPYCRGVAFEEEWRRRAEWGQPLAEQWSGWIAHHQRVEEADIAGQPARTAPHLVAFRSWLLEQMRREPGRRFFNVSGAGILHGDGISQLSFDALRGRLTPQADIFGQRVRNAWRPASAAGAIEAARSLPVPEEWQQFASGIPRDEIARALHAAGGGRPSSDTVRVDPSARPSRSELALVAEWLLPLCQNLPLVPLRIPRERITEWAATGARMFYFRTTAARLVLTALQIPEGALLENGQPLRLAASVEHVEPGTYRMCRDEIHFMATDGSDPRWNGREYAVLVPRCIAELESLPLQDILERGF